MSMKLSTSILITRIVVHGAIAYTVDLGPVNHDEQGNAVYEYNKHFPWDPRKHALLLLDPDGSGILQVQGIELQKQPLIQIPEMKKPFFPGGGFNG